MPFASEQFEIPRFPAFVTSTPRDSIRCCEPDRAVWGRRYTLPSIKGRVARDEEHIGTPGSGRVRVILLKTRRRLGASPGPIETTTRSSSKGSVWALSGGTQTEPSP